MLLNGHADYFTTFVELFLVHSLPCRCRALKKKIYFDLYPDLHSYRFVIEVNNYEKRANNAKIERKYGNKASHVHSTLP